MLQGSKTINADYPFDLPLITLSSLDGVVPLEEMHDHLLPSLPLTILTNARCPHDLLPALCRFRIVLICLAMCAARHGRTELLDEWGGAVVVSDDVVADVEIF